jgi:hypothetical protein
LVEIGKMKTVGEGPDAVTVELTGADKFSNFPKDNDDRLGTPHQTKLVGESATL